MKRCRWATTDLSLEYHDTEWGVPVHDDRVLFEFLILEGAQAGLSWETILRKRARYREVFDGFDPARVARYDDAKKAELLLDPGIIRNRAKITAAVGNAQAFLRLQADHGTFETWLWRFVDGRPIIHDWEADPTLPARTDLSDRLSKALLKAGFKFVGSTICYAFMQAVGLVNDHEPSCFRRRT